MKKRNFGKCNHYSRIGFGTFRCFPRCCKTAILCDANLDRICWLDWNFGALAGPTLIWPWLPSASRCKYMNMMFIYICILIFIYTLIYWYIYILIYLQFYWFTYWLIYLLTDSFIHIFFYLYMCVAIEKMSNFCRGIRPEISNLVQWSWDITGEAPEDALVCSCTGTHSSLHRRLWRQNLYMRLQPKLIDKKLGKGNNRKISFGREELQKVSLARVWQQFLGDSSRVSAKGRFSRATCFPEKAMTARPLLMRPGVGRSLASAIKAASGLLHRYLKADAVRGRAQRRWICCIEKMGSKKTVAKNVWKTRQHSLHAAKGFSIWSWWSSQLAGRLPLLSAVLVNPGTTRLQPPNAPRFPKHFLLRQPLNPALPLAAP